VLILAARLFVQLAPRDVVEQTIAGRAHPRYNQERYNQEPYPGQNVDDENTVSTTWRVVDDK
jgi:hypothetical protein